MLVYFTQVTPPDNTELTAITAALSSPSSSNPILKAAAEGNLQETSKVFNQYATVLNLQASSSANSKYLTYKTLY